MARLFPFRSEPSTGDGQPRIVDLEGEDADAVFSALSSTTARQIYARLDDDPGTPSDIADAIDSSIQNVRYHLENLENAGLVEVVDTWYSSRGNEMSVYATTDGPLIVTSDESTASQLKTAISRLIGGIGALAGGSLLVQYGLTRWFGFDGANDAAPSGGGASSGGTDGTADESTEGDPGDDTEGSTDGGSTGEDADGGSTDGSDESGGTDSEDDFTTEDVDGGTEEEEPSEDDAAGDDSAAEEDDAAAEGDATDGEPIDSDYNDTAENVTDGAMENVSDGGAEAAEAVFGTVPPGLLFFLGGLVVLLGVTIYWYWYRPHY